ICAPRDGHDAREWRAIFDRWRVRLDLYARAPDALSRDLLRGYGRGDVSVVGAGGPARSTAREVVGGRREPARPRQLRVFSGTDGREGAHLSLLYRAR